MKRLTLAALLAMLPLGAVQPASAQAGCPAVIVETFGYLAYDACYVAWHESRWRSDAISATGDYGLFQINRATWGARATLDPVANTRFAYELSKGGTDWCTHWRWTCS